MKKNLEPTVVADKKKNLPYNFHNKLHAHAHTHTLTSALTVSLRNTHLLKSSSVSHTKLPELHIFKVDR